MNASRTFIRVAGEAFDADQIENDDPFFISDAEMARISRQAADIAKRNANFRAGRGWVVTVKDHGNGRGTLAA